MKDLITITKQVIGNGEINAVDARGLWILLESKQEFATWIKNKIERYDFVQGTDFISFGNSVKAKNTYINTKEYTISIDMAKELSMVERNAKGKEARQYFIECEKIAKGTDQTTELLPKEKAVRELKTEIDLLSLFEIPKHLLQIEAVKQVKKDTGFDFSHALLLAPAQNEIKAKDVMLEPTELGKQFNLSGVKMNQKLMKMGLQINDGTGWIPTKKGAKISSKHAWSAGSKSGYNLKWNLAKVKRLVK